MKTRKLFTEDIVNVAKQLYNNGQSCQQIANLLDFTIDVVQDKLKETDVVMRSHNKKYTVNDNYFENIDTPDKAYFLGLLTADGSINKNTICIYLQERDSGILRKFKDYIQTNSPLDKRIRKFPQSSLIGFHVTSPKIVNDLSKWGVVKNKTFKTYFPPIAEELWNHFIRGVFDGDGCIWTGNANRNWSTIGAVTITGNLELMNAIQDILVKECRLQKNKINLKLCKDGVIGNLVYGGNKQVLRIKNYLYKDCRNLYLTRKLEKFNKLKTKQK